jgi:quercetin dioxygenase-like cupin family protein
MTFHDEETAMIADPITLQKSEAYERHASREHSMWYRGDLFTFLAEGKDTDGKFTMIEFAPKRGLEPPPHTHTFEDESLYVLSGELTFTVGEQHIKAGPGSYVVLPRGVRHGWRIHTEEARLLMIFSPAGMEGFFKQLALPVEGEELHNAPQTRPDMVKMLALADQYGLIFGPPKN